MSVELLLEIGTEEIPSGYLEGGLNELKRLAETCLRENRIGMEEGLIIYGTPRRLVLIGRAISRRQDDLVEEMMGPPKNVAYDKEGNPTKAALGFAERQGVPIDEIGFKETPKGEYLFIKRKVSGRPAKEVLEEALPKLIAGITWPKSMRWGSLDFPFVRPIHWILALLDGEVIPFDVAGTKSGKTTKGHRFMSPDTKEVLNVQDYLDKMEKAYVMVDPQKRVQAVEKMAKEAAESVGGKPAQDPELVTTVANLVEYPSAVCGHFDRAFLELPDPVLITAMKEHQKYFAVYGEKNRLMPNFVAVNNTIVRDENVARRGHERVLRARLSDAAFFFEEDRKKTLDDRLDDLKGVIYQAQLGTSHMKVKRFTKLAEYLTEKILPEKTSEVSLTARLCKCDLVTQLVTEFPTLQGVMGTVYAQLEGHPEEVSLAIHDHYLPTRAGGPLPSTGVGAIVGLADRMDTICGCFAVGLEPSGSADPFALRRHALASIRIIEEKEWDISLKAFVEKALSVLQDDIEVDREDVSKRVLNFFRERYKQRLIRHGYESDLIEAVISVHFDHIFELRPRIDQLKSFYSESEEFRGLALTFKRVSNILKKQKGPFKVDAALFKESCEATLWDTYTNLKDDIAANLKKRDYSGALKILIRFRKPVDDFFEGVEILTKESEALKDNRVGMLHQLAQLFLSVADLSKFSI